MHRSISFFAYAINGCLTPPSDLLTALIHLSKEWLTSPYCQPKHNWFYVAEKCRGKMLVAVCARDPRGSSGPSRKGHQCD